MLFRSGAADFEGQVLDKSVLFGEHAEVYDVLINQYIHDYSIEYDIQKTVASLVEIGVHKMGHVKNLVDICYLK